MAGPIGTQARWSIKCSQGNKRLKRVSDYKVSDGSSLEGATAVGEDRAIGVIEKPGALTITFEIYTEQGNPEIDYRKLKLQKEWFSMIKGIVGGKRYEYGECRVSKIEPAGDKDGKHMESVEIIALGEDPL